MGGREDVGKWLLGLSLAAHGCDDGDWGQLQQLQHLLGCGGISQGILFGRYILRDGTGNVGWYFSVQYRVREQALETRIS